MMVDTTFPALEEHKAEAEGVDVFIELAPVWLEAGIEWLFESDYRAQRQRLTEQRDEYRQLYQRSTSHIEQTYGTVVSRALRRRDDGDDPEFDLDRALDELEDAKRELDRLRHGDGSGTDDGYSTGQLDDDFLTTRERRHLVELTNDVVRALEYVRNTRIIKHCRRELTPEIDEFDRRFSPYVGADQYMLSADEAYLTAQSREIWERLVDAMRSLQSSVVSDDDAEWLAQTRSRFRKLVDGIPKYNERFVEKETAVYDDLLTTEHGPLNERQRKAVVRNDRRNLVDASAGTGKTLTLTYRVLYLLEKGVPVDDIVAITYTNDAAAEMTRRIAEAADVRESDLNISTIHSFARETLGESRPSGRSDGELGSFRETLVESAYRAAERGERDPDLPTPNDVDVSDSYETFRTATEDFFGTPAALEYIDDERDDPRRTFLTEKLDTFVDQARSFGRTPDAIRADLDPERVPEFAFGRMGAAMLSMYLRCVEAADAPLDFDEMIYGATAAIREAPDKFGSRYRHILVDEFQDLSPATLSFVEAFMEADRSGTTRLFCVGDDWQSIFGFTGSNVTFFTNYESDHEEVTYTSLMYNYRCPPSVVDAGTTLIEKSRVEQNDKPVEATSDLPTRPTLHEFADLYTPRASKYAFDLITDRLDGEYEYADIMVLSRNDKESPWLSEVRDHLEVAEIPHRRPKGVDDYLPPGYAETFDRRVEYDEKGNAVLASEDGGEPQSVPMVTVQSIHGSKGTEAPVVILLNAVDDEYDGVPQSPRPKPLLEPAKDVTADYYAEERRLFYVALTRTENEFHTLTRTGAVSRYVTDISDYFDTVAVPTPSELLGQCVDIDPPDPNTNQPYEFELETKEFAITIKGWFDSGTLPFEEGGVYRVTDFTIEDNGFGEEIKYDTATVERVGYLGD